MAKTQIVLQPADVARLRRAHVALSDVLGAVVSATSHAASVQSTLSRSRPRTWRRNKNKNGAKQKKSVAVVKSQPEVSDTAAGS